MDIKLWLQSMVAIRLNCNSQAAISHVYSEIYNGKSRSIGIRHAYIRKLILSQVISIIFVKSGDSLIDPLTEPLTKELVRKTVNGMGLKLFNLSTNDGNQTLN